MGRKCRPGCMKCISLRRAMKLPFQVQIILLHLSMMEHISGRISCPSLCQCVPTMIVCKDAGLEILPPPPSPKLEVVVITNQVFSSTVLDANSLRPYWSPDFNGEILLKMLKIRYCNIATVAAYAFAKLGNQLEELDLSGNPIQILLPNVFAGLNLKSLFLNNLFNLTVDDKAFSGISKVQYLSLQNSQLSTVSHYALNDLVTFRSLKDLDLRGNQLVTLRPAFASIFELLNSFDLTENPWNCDCRLQWLITMFKNKDASNRVIKSSSYAPQISQNPTCRNPDNLHGYEFKQIVTDSNKLFSEIQFIPSKYPYLVCQLPKLDNVEIDLRGIYKDNGGSQHVTLGCQMLGPSDMVLNWAHRYQLELWNNVTTQSHRHTILNRYQEIMSYQREGSSPILRKQSFINVTQIEETDVYLCHASTLLGSVNTTVHIKWPVISNVLSASTGVWKENSILKQFDELHVVIPDNFGVLSKRFSLIDITGAVLGTFFVTVAIFILLLRYTEIYSTHKSNYFSQALHLEHAVDDTSKASLPDSSISVTNSSQMKKSNTAEKFSNSLGYPDHDASNGKEHSRVSDNNVSVLQNQYVGNGAVDNSKFNPKGFLPEQHYSKANNFDSLATSNNCANAYETLYGDSNQFMYDIPNEHYIGQFQPLMIQQNVQQTSANPMLNCNETSSVHSNSHMTRFRTISLNASSPHLFQYHPAILDGMSHIQTYWPLRSTFNVNNPDPSKDLNISQNNLHIIMS